MWTAVGKTSFDDCPMLTWSLGWTGFLLPTVAAEDLDRAVRDHLVGVHVAGGARPGLEDVDDELAVVLSGGDLVRGLDDRVGQLGVQLAAVAVHLGGRLLDQRQRADHAAGKAQPADREVLGGPLRLRPVERVGRDFDLTERVGFDAGTLRSTFYDSSNSTSAVRSSAPASRRAPDSSAVVLRSRSASTCVNAHSSLVDSCGSLRMIS